MLRSVFISSFLILLLPLSSFAKKTCTYEYDQKDVLVEGTGYKYLTKRAGVTGAFKDIRLLAQGSKKSIIAMLRGTQVTVDLNTIDSGHTLRDDNLRKAIFSNMKDNGVVTVTVKKVVSDSLVAEMKINGISKDVTFPYTFRDNHLDLRGHIEGKDYGMGPLVEALSKLCRIFHTKDGKTKTWSDFDLHVRVRVKETCG